MKKQKEFFNLFDLDEENETGEDSEKGDSDTQEQEAGSQFSFFENEFNTENNESGEVTEDIQEVNVREYTGLAQEETGNNADIPSFEEENKDTSVTDRQDSTASTENFKENTPSFKETSQENKVFSVSDDIEQFTDDDSADGSEERTSNFVSQNVKDGTEDEFYYAYNDDAEKMVSILEDDVSTEITIDSPPKTPSTREPDVLPMAELKNFKEIKNKSTASRFETPYIYSGKSGDRVRYRLALPSDKNPRKARRIKDILNMTATLLIALLIALLLRNFVFVFATVNGPSMQPTLQTGEKIFVTRYTYYFSEIERGDIIVCKYPSEMYQDNYVKRVIALGGERVRIQDGTVYINDVPLSEDYIYSAPREDMAEVTVPDGSVFVMGDNRNNSTDSRKSYIGPISKKLIIGKARCILYPFSEIRSLENEN